MGVHGHLNQPNYDVILSEIEIQQCALLRYIFFNINRILSMAYFLYISNTALAGAIDKYMATTRRLLRHKPFCSYDKHKNKVAFKHRLPFFRLRKIFIPDY